MEEEHKEGIVHPIHTTSAWPIRSPWRDLLINTVEQVQQKILLVSPFLTEDVIATLETVLQKRATEQANCIDMRLLTRIRLDDFISGASSIDALERLLQWSILHPTWRTQIRAVDNIHAKVWIFDEQLAFVGSGNATHSGLEVNIEYGLAVKEPQLVAQILADWQTYWEKATAITLTDLASMSDALRRLRADPLLTEIEQSSTQRRNAIIEETHVRPRLGGKIVLPRRKRSPLNTPYLKESPQLFPEETFLDAQQRTTAIPDTSKSAYLTIQEVPIIPAQTIFLSQYDLRLALNWTFPAPEQWDLTDAYLRIDWFAASSELQLTRANKAQLSRATIRCYAQDTNIGNRHITLDKWKIKELSSQVSVTDGLPSLAQSSLLDLQIEVAVWPERNGIGALEVPVNFDKQTLNTLDPIPAIHNIPALQKPLSHITVAHKAFVEQLRHLEFKWQEDYPDTAFPEIIEIRFSHSESKPRVILSTGPLDHRLTTFVLGSNAVLMDAAISVRLNTIVLRRILESAMSFVDEWHLQIGYDASALQLLPTQALHKSEHLWFHQLNNME